MKKSSHERNKFKIILALAFFVVLFLNMSLTYWHRKIYEQNWTCVREETFPWNWFEDSPECLEALGSFNRNDTWFLKECFQNTTISLVDCLIEYSNATDSYRHAQTKEQCEIKDGWHLEITNHTCFEERLEEYGINALPTEGWFLPDLDECLERTPIQKLVCGDKEYDLKELMIGE